MLFKIAAFACLGGYLYGYDLGLISGALAPIQAELEASDFAIEIMVGGAKFGAVFGTFLGGALMLHYGRRKAIGLDSLFFFLGPLSMAFSSSMLGLTIGRVLVGIGIGVSAVVVPSYLGEVAPAAIRGRIVEAYEVLLCIGMLMAMLVDAALQNVSNNWRWMVGAPVIPALFLAVALFILPESPRWLVTQGRLDEALAVIHQVYTRSHLPAGAQESTAEVEQELLELWSSVEKEREAAREIKLQAHQQAVARAAARGWRKTWRKGAKHRRSSTGDETAAATDKAQYLNDIELASEQQPSSSGRPPESSRQDRGAGSHSAGQLHLRGHEERQALIRTAQIPAAEDQLIRSAELTVVNGSQEVPLSVFPEAPPPLSPQPSSSVQVELADPASPLYRSLSEIPKNLPPVRTKSEDGLDLETALTPRAPKIARHPSRSHREKESFWKTFWEMMKQIGSVAKGEERQAFLIALVLAFVNQAIASSSIINYAPQMISETGISSHTTATLLTSTITAAKMSGVVLGVALIDTLGRRPLLVWGSAACSASLVLLFGGVFMQSTVFEILAMCAFMLSFNASYAGVFWVLLSELFSMTAKSPAASAATAMMFLAGAATDSLFLSLLRWCGSYSFFVYAGIAAFGGIFCYLKVPETKCCTLAEVQAVLKGRQQDLPQTTEELGIQEPSPGHGKAEIVSKGLETGDTQHLLAGKALSDDHVPS